MGFFLFQIELKQYYEVASWKVHFIYCLVRVCAWQTRKIFGWNDTNNSLEIVYIFIVFLQNNYYKNSTNK